MSTLVVSNISDGTTTVGASYVTNGSAKVWINFDTYGSTVVNDSFSVSSVTDNGQGLSSVNYSSAFVNTYFHVAIGAPRYNLGNAAFIIQEYDATSSRTSSSVKIATTQTAAYDTPNVGIAVFGDLA